jgi:hypothetical protein
MIPNLSKSYRAAPACIISTAQQARPKVIGQILPFLAQFTNVSTLDTTYSAEDEALPAAGESALAAVETARKAPLPPAAFIVLRTVWLLPSLGIPSYLFYGTYTRRIIQ